jgi:hypothetical protein
MQSFWILAFVLVSSVLTAARDLQICPIKGQQFPPPERLANAPAFRNATRSIEKFISANLNQTAYKETSFSLSIFSVDDPELLYQYHHTDSLVASSGNGTNSVDANSVSKIK